MTGSGRGPITEPVHRVLVTLGGASLIAPPGGQVLLGPGKPLALVTYLALSPGRTATREFLTGLLWADMDSDRARHALRQTLWQLRQLLGEETLTGRDEIRLTTDIASDRDAFLAAVERGDFEAAVELYTGPFLARWRSTARLPLDQQYRIWFAGNSANTRILAGLLEVWSGVRGDVDWAVTGGSGR